MDLTPMEAARIAEAMGTLAHASKTFCQGGIVAGSLETISRYLFNLSEGITEERRQLGNALRKLAGELKEQREDRQAARALTNRLLDMVDQERQAGFELAEVRANCAALTSEVSRLSRELQRRDLAEEKRKKARRKK